MDFPILFLLRVFYKQPAKDRFLDVIYMIILNALRSMIVADNRSMYWTSARGYDSDSKKN